MHALFAICLLPFGAIHFLPTIIALLRDTRGKFGIFMINLFFGWTVIGWVIALFLALRNEPRWTRAYAYAPAGYSRRY
ncbi:MAG: superinfection immunity protein [Acidobacteriaceae bacterium]|nr:superinfection immunity protein [Acidobacteriaceae bacterium]